jgi:hypothetical protein
MMELAFFLAMNAWEAFLEESFILYLLGKQAPRGKKTRRYGFPPNEDAAYEWVKDGRDYAKWTPDVVKGRATRLFRDGYPYDAALTAHQNRLFQLKVIRNAIAHNSESARLKFEKLVRDELKALPAGTTVGSFLLTAKPASSPPVSYLEFYFDELATVSRKIVPN